MRRWSAPPGLALLIPLALALLILGAAAGSPASGVPLEFRRDLRLTRKVTVQLRFTTLADVLAEVGKSTGVRLRADAGISGENVIVLVKDRAAAEVLELLAEALQYVWTPLEAEKPETGYRLVQSLADRKGEAQLRERFRQLSLAGLDREVTAVLEEAKRDFDQRYHRTQAIRDELQHADLPPERRRVLDQERSRLSATLNGRSVPLLELYRHLSPERRDSLLRGEILRFSSQPTPGMGSLPAPAAETILTARVDDVAEWYRRLPTPPEIRADLRVRSMAGRVTLLARSQVMAPPPPEYATGPDIPTLVQSWTQPEELGPGFAVTPTAFTDARLKAEVAITISQQKRAVRQNPSTYVRNTTPADILAALAEAQPNLAFVGDCYLKPLGFGLTSKGAAGEVLNRLGSQAGFRWRFDERGYVLFRSPIVFRERPGAVPASTLRRAMDRSLRSTDRLADHAALAVELSDEQLDVLSLELPNSRSLFFSYPPLEPRSLAEYRHDLRLLGRLTITQRAVLTRGGTLPVASLAPGQREAYRLALESSEVLMSKEPIGMPAEEAWVQGAVRLSYDGEKPPGTRYIAPVLRYFGADGVLTSRTLVLRKGDPEDRPVDDR